MASITVTCADNLRGDPSSIIATAVGIDFSGSSFVSTVEKLLRDCDIPLPIVHDNRKHSIAGGWSSVRVAAVDGDIEAYKWHDCLGVEVSAVVTRVVYDNQCMALVLSHKAPEDALYLETCDRREVFLKIWEAPGLAADYAFNLVHKKPLAEKMVVNLMEKAQTSIRDVEEWKKGKSEWITLQRKSRGMAGPSNFPACPKIFQAPTLKGLVGMRVSKIGTEDIKRVR